MKKNTKIQSIALSDKVGLYSIIFENNKESEFREFLI